MCSHTMTNFVELDQNLLHFPTEKKKKKVRRRNRNEGMMNVILHVQQPMQLVEYQREELH